MYSDLDAVFDKLFPICRSITGQGVRDSLHILKEHIPLEMKSVPSGTQVFDWQIPDEWNLTRATLTDPDGEIILDTDVNNLHVLNYSIPFEGALTLQQLQPHLHSKPRLPDAIPYVTSYYQDRWGMCLSQNQRDALQDGVYYVSIKTRKQPGVLNYASYDLQGETDKTILLSSYLCHPSLANNELSGPLALVRLYEMLAALPSRRYTYRFLLIPETIGSLTYLAQEGERLCTHLDAGMVLTCLGGHKSSLSIKLSRRDWMGQACAVDEFVRALNAADPEGFTLREFDPSSGSDERQFCSPQVNLPVVQAAKTVYSNYPEYHTSLDNKQLMTIEAVEKSAEQIACFWQLYELRDKVLHNLIEAGEPQLGAKDLYPTINGPQTSLMSTDNHKDQRVMLKLLLKVLSLSDGTLTVLDVLKKLACNPNQLLSIVNSLEEKQVIELRDTTYQCEFNSTSQRTNAIYAGTSGN